jgi:hypothetical protein
VKVALIGMPSSARAPLDSKTTVIAASINRHKELKSTFLLESNFRNIVTSSTKRF